jgi:hypothetical protein
MRFGAVRLALHSCSKLQGFQAKANKDRSFVRAEGKTSIYNINFFFPMHNFLRKFAGGERFRIKQK